MSKGAYNLSCCYFNLFIISIIFLLISGCGFNNSAHIEGREYTRAPNVKNHVVARGETLFSIAWRYNMKYQDLAKYNGISYPYVIKPQQTIKLYPPRSQPVSLHSKAPKKSVIATRVPNVQTAKLPNQATPKRQENKSPAFSPNDKILPIATALKWGWPAEGPILSGFRGNSGFNKGIDLGGKLGEPVVSAALGEVVYAGSGLRGYGKLLIVKHDDVFLSAYAHNDQLLVKEGDLVKAGQIIADMGSSGTDRVKLHFEIRRDGTPVDPLTYLPKR
jgi:lipoprotein NlpD